MRRIIFVPQYPSKMRYQEWWYTKFPEEFSKRGYEVVTLGSLDKYVNYDTSLFSPVKASIQYETQQIHDFLNLELYDDDILFLSDISFPGLFTTVLYHKRCKHMFAFCHATSLNRYDYFESCKNSKFLVETGFSKMFNKVFVGSEYHKKKLGWDNTIVTYLPFPPFEPKKENKTVNIISVARPSVQKRDDLLESFVEKRFGGIFRPVCSSWDDYFSYLSMSKVLLVTANEDTFGYQIVDAVLNGCIPIARNKFAYPEILPKIYLYDNTIELLQKIELALNGQLPVPEIKCKAQMEHFYDNIVEEIENAV